MARERLAGGRFARARLSPMATHLSERVQNLLGRVLMSWQFAEHVLLLYVRAFDIANAAGSTGHCNTALSLSAGVSNPKVFLGRWFKRNAILFKYD